MENKEIKVIEDEAGAKQVLSEMNEEIAKLESMDPKERKLEAFRLAKDAFNQMEQAWKKMDRKGKRKLINPEMKFSSKIRKILKGKK
jgi:predicted lipid-binding transport protein (Tim44 family)